MEQGRRVIDKPDRMQPPGATIAYLAPELPALSATFVYQEILAVERKGVRVIPFSVHPPAVAAKEYLAKKLAHRTRILYQQPKYRVLAASLFQLLRHPGRFFSTFGQVISDCITVGFFTKTAFKLPFQFISACWLSRQLKVKNCEHLHIHFAHVATQIGMYAASMANIPFSFTAHACDIFRQGLLLQRKSERAKRIVTISNYNRDYLASIGIPRSEIEIVRASVNMSNFEPRPAFSEAPEIIRIGSLGRLVETKGMDILLRSVRQLLQKGIRVQLEIAGDGPRRHQYETLAAELEITRYVDFRGALAHNQVPTWMKNLDLFVLACRKDSKNNQDGIPVVLMEAMAMEIPVVSTRISGIPELIDHGISGLLAEPGEVDDLVANIESAIGDYQRLRQLGVKGRERVIAEFEVDLNADRLLKVFDLSGNGRRVVSTIVLETTQSAD